MPPGRDPDDGEPQSPTVASRHHGRVCGLCGRGAVRGGQLLRALGGTAGIDTLGGKLEQLARDGDPVVLWLAGAAGALKVAGAVLALALVRPWGRVVPRRLLLVAAWAGSVVLVLYGALNVVGGALVLAGAVEVSGPLDRTALWWHVAVWDLWFLVWGVLLGVAAWRYGRR
jgi:hypothetical protein